MEVGGRSGQRGCDHGREVRVRQCARTWPFIAGFEDGGRSHQPVNAHNLTGARRSKEIDSPLKPPERDTALPAPCF